MADTKISAGADPGTLVATDKLPLARSASTTAYAATVAEIAAFANGAYVPNYATANPSMDGAAAPGTASTVSRGDHVHPTDTTRAAASAIPAPAVTPPAMDGTAATGTAVTYSRADHVHPTNTATLLLAGGTMTGPVSLASGSTAPTVTPAGDSTTKLATTAFVQAALGAAGAGVSSWNTRAGAVTLLAADVTGTGVLQYPNYVDNSGFAIRQRSYTSGTALAAGAYAHDRWKAGAGGCTYTFTQSGGPSTMITITAGTLQQVVEGASVAGGNYMLSWIGTAQGRVGAGSYAASPVAVSGIVAGANTTIEFNAGTLGQVKLESGTAATAWVAPSVRHELANCQRFYQVGSVYMNTYNTAGAQFGLSQPFPVVMRGTPAVALSGFGYANASGASVLAPTAFNFVFNATVTAAATAIASANYTATADL